MTVIDLKYIMPARLNAMHGEWQELKGKYAEVIKSNNIKFDKKMGPMLDKRKTLIKAIQGYKPGDVALLVKSRLNDLKKNAASLKTVSKLYLDRVKVMGDPAKKEMTAFLVDVSRAATNDIAWADGKLRAMLTPKKK